MSRTLKDQPHQVRARKFGRPAEELPAQRHAYRDARNYEVQVALYASALQQQETFKTLAAAHGCDVASKETFGYLDRVERDQSTRFIQDRDPILSAFAPEVLDRVIVSTADGCNQGKHSPFGPSHDAAKRKPNLFTILTATKTIPAAPAEDSPRYELNHEDRYTRPRRRSASRKAVA